MNSNRLLQIALYIDYSDSVIDVGCDHALLDIYLIENNICRKTLASDISINALNQGIANIKKHDLYSVIPTIVSNGISDINTRDYNTLVISGMGAHTILDILSDKKKLEPIKKIIIESNNEYRLVRKYLNSIGFYLEDEAIVNDNDHYYPVMKFIKSSKKNPKKTIKYGIFKIANISYYEEVVLKNRLIIKSIKKLNCKKIGLIIDNIYYERYIKKITGRKLVK